MKQLIRGLKRSFVIRHILITTGALLVMSLSSCDPSYCVILSNRSATSRHIKVIYPPGLKYPVKDSLRTYDNRTRLSKRYTQKPLKTSLINPDTIAGTYTFILPAGYDAVTEGRSFASTPVYGQKFVLEDKDTIILKMRDKTFRRSWIFGGSWTYTIRN